jgi:hypothetical protein
MSLKDRIQEDVKDAMRAKDKPRLATIRLITAAIKQREVDERIELDDTQVLVVLDKMCKQRRESISQFEQAGRDDLAAQEKAELELIQQYLPEQLSEAETFLTRANQLNPALPEPYFGLGVLYRLQGQRERAIAAFETFLELGPGQDPAAMPVAEAELEALRAGQ